MPKLPIPEKLQKSMFWIVVGVLSLFSVIIWWLGASAVAKMRSDDIATINGYFGTIGGASPTANETTVEAMTNQAKARTKSMNEAWQRVHDRQKKELAWPENVLDQNGAVLKRGLPKEFVEVANSLPPPEWLPADREVVREDAKEIYRNYARLQIRDLCDIISAEHRLEERRGVAPAQGSNAASKSDDAPMPGEICVWPTASQQVAQDFLTFAEGSNPPVQDIVYAQESTWVYQSLFKIIKATNDSIKESTPSKDLAHYNAPVKIVHEVSIGEKFVVKEDEAVRPGSAAASSSDEAETKIPPSLRRAALRFVNERGKRMKNEELLSLESPGPNSDPSRSYAQYKLMPVFMRLEVDQRYLGRLLVECANSPLTVEVKDVSFNVLGHADREAATTQDAGGAKAGPKESKNFYDVTVEITGHIYIYYPPQKDAAPAEETPPAEATLPEVPAQAGG